MGKTTTAINLASSFAAAEVNTLLIDCDPQSNASSGLGLAKDPERISTYDLLMGGAAAEDALQPTELEQLWIIPAHKNLIGANLELVDVERREYRLRDALAPLYQRFQFIVLDCPPALDLLTLNALVAADTVLIPMQAEYFALEGISELLDTVERIRASFNPDLGLEGVVLTMFDERTSLAKQVTAELKKYFSEKLCATTIPRNIRLAEAPSHGKPALVYDVKSRGAESYIRLAKEIITHYMEAGSAVEMVAVAAGEPNSSTGAVEVCGQEAEPADVGEELESGEVVGQDAVAADAVPETPEVTGMPADRTTSGTEGEGGVVEAAGQEHQSSPEEFAQAAAAGVGNGEVEVSAPSVVEEIVVAGEADQGGAAEVVEAQEMDKSA